jgi:hypothetical protein
MAARRHRDRALPHGARVRCELGRQRFLRRGVEEAVKDCAVEFRRELIGGDAAIERVALLAVAAAEATGSRVSFSFSTEVRKFSSSAMRADCSAFGALPACTRTRLPSTKAVALWRASLSRALAPLTPDWIAWGPGTSTANTGWPSAAHAIKAMESAYRPRITPPLGP